MAAAVTAAHDAGSKPAVLQLLGQPQHGRRLAGAAGRYVPDDDDRGGSTVGAQYAAVEQVFTEHDDEPVESAQRQQQPA